MRIRTLRSSAALCVIAACLVSCAPEADPPAEPTVLTLTSAAETYLDAVCPLNSAWDRVDTRVDALRQAISAGSPESGALLHAVRSELRHTAQVGERAAAALGAADLKWPAEAEASVGAVIDSLQRDATEIGQVLELSAERTAAYTWADPGTADALAGRVRADLGLPDDPRAACQGRADGREPGDAPQIAPELIYRPGGSQ